MCLPHVLPDSSGVMASFRTWACTSGSSLASRASWIFSLRLFSSPRAWRFFLLSFRRAANFPKPLAFAFAFGFAKPLAFAFAFGFAKPFDFKIFSQLWEAYQTVPGACYSLQTPLKTLISQAAADANMFSCFAR